MWLLFFGVILWGLPVCAQQTVSLRFVLDKISEWHQVKFNFLEDDIAEITLPLPDYKSAFSDQLTHIETQTGVHIERVNDRYFTVVAPNKNKHKYCGYLFDNDTHVPVESASITYFTGTVGTVTNKDGYFELWASANGAVSFKISHLNYEKKVVGFHANQITCGTFYLNAHVQKLDEVKTFRYLTQGIYKRNDGSLKMIPNRLGLLPGMVEPDVLQTLQQLPGIQSVDESVSAMNVRGGTHDQNLFLWNGIRLFQTSHFFGMISMINPSLPQSISIYKNGTSALFGESVSSSIDINTHPSFAKNSTHSVGINGISADAYSSTKLNDRNRITFAVRRSFTDYLALPTYAKYRDKVFQNFAVTTPSISDNSRASTAEKFYFYDFTAQWQAQLGKKHQLFTDALLVKNNLTVDKVTTEKVGSALLSQQSAAVGLQCQSQWTKAYKSTFLGYYSQYKLESVNESLLSLQRLNQVNKVSDFGFQWNNIYQWNRQFQLAGGWQQQVVSVLNSDEINSPFYLRSNTNVLKSYTAFAEGTYQSTNEKHRLQLGVRNTFFDPLATFSIEPRFQYNYAFDKVWSFELLGEKKTQTLSQTIDLQQDFLGIEKHRWIIANNQSNPIQVSKQLSVGCHFRKNGWLFTSELFYKKVDGIATASQGFQNQFEKYHETGSYRVLGTELLLLKSTERVNTWISYCYNDNQYEFDPLNPPVFTNNYQVRHHISWAISYDVHQWKLAVGGKWHTGKPITTAQLIQSNGTNQLVYSAPNSDQLPLFFQVNASVSRQWALTDRSQLKAGFSVLNILNNTNKINQYDRFNASTGAIERVEQYALAFTPNFNVSLLF